MTPFALPVPLSLWAEIAPGELFRILQRNLGVKARKRIHTPRVVLWMMMGSGWIREAPWPVRSSSWYKGS